MKKYKKDKEGSARKDMRKKTYRWRLFFYFFVLFLIFDAGVIIFNDNCKSKKQTIQFQEKHIVVL
jgi:hypothetical protein